MPVWWLISHPELSACRSPRMSIWVFLFHQYIKFEVRRRSRSNGWFSVTAHIRLVILTFELFTLELVCNVARGKDNLPANVGACVTFRYWVMREHASDWPYYLERWPLTSPRINDARHCETSMYQVWSSSVSPFGRCGAFSVSVLIRLETFRPLMGCTDHPCHGLHYCQFPACYSLPFLTSGQTQDCHGHTDWQRDDGRQRLMPSACGDGSIRSYQLTEAITFQLMKLTFPLFTHSLGSARVL